MRVRIWASALAALVAVSLIAAAPPSTAPEYRDGVSTQPVVIYDATGNVVSSFGDSVVRGTAVYRGASLAANTSTQIMTANAARRGFTIQNQTAGNCGVKIGGAAATLDQLSLRIAPGALYETPSHHVSTGAVAVICAAAGGVYATEF